MADFAARRVMMVDTQVRPSDVTKFPIIQAMLSVPREDFVPRWMRAQAYADQPLEIGAGHPRPLRDQRADEIARPVLLGRRRTTNGDRGFAPSEAAPLKPGGEHAGADRLPAFAVEDVDTAEIATQPHL